MSGPRHYGRLRCTANLVPVPPLGGALYTRHEASNDVQALTSSIFFGSIKLRYLRLLLFFSLFLSLALVGKVFLFIGTWTYVYTFAHSWLMSPFLMFCHVVFICTTRSCVAAPYFLSRIPRSCILPSSVL